MKVIDYTDAIGAAQAISDSLKAYRDNTGDAAAIQLVIQCEQWASIDLASAGLMAIGAMAMLQHRIPEAADLLSRVALGPLGANVKA